MKNIIRSLAIVSVLSGLLVIPGCAYSHAVAVGKQHVVVLRNDGFLFGLLRKAYVCKATANGLEKCQDSENP